MVLPHLATSLAAFGVAAAIWAAYSCAGTLAAWLGRDGARTVTRPSAFLLLCIGIETGLHGIASAELAGVHKETDWTAGCIAVDDAEIDEISALVKDGTPIEIQD